MIFQIVGWIAVVMCIIMFISTSYAIAKDKINDENLNAVKIHLGLWAILAVLCLK